MKMKSILFVLSLFILSSCFNDTDDNGIFIGDINDFVWKGMNVFYLYKADVSDLANDRFTSDQEYTDYLNSFNSPETLFEGLIYERETVDKFSWIVDDYIALEQLFDGIIRSNGMEFNLYLAPGSSTEVFGAIRLVLPNSEASEANLQRGQIFNSVDGTMLNDSNFQTLLGQDSFTIDLATYNDNGTPQTSDDTIESDTESVLLTKVPYTENPVFKTEIIDVNGQNVGYLMYNGFVRDFESELNAAFLTFANANIQHLVLDVRYNPGGTITVAANLGSMITGQFTGQVFTKLEFNENFDTSFYNFESTISSGQGINSLNLNKVYVLTSGSSASASEMVINSLKPYINVVQIGTTTTGKSQASRTIYDSSDFNRQGANPNHTYAMQPLVAISVNRNDGQVPSSGLVPNIEVTESPIFFGEIGNPTEPLLAAALDEIANGRSATSIFESVEIIGESNDLIPFSKEMYIDRDIPMLWNNNQE